MKFCEFLGEPLPGQGLGGSTTDTIKAGFRARTIWLTMDQSYLIEMLERAVIVQEKRVWTLNMLRRIESGAMLTDLSEAERSQTISKLESSLRISRDVLDEIARESGFSAAADRILDPSFVLGFGGAPVTESLAAAFDRVAEYEKRRGTEHLSAMARELRVRHEPFLESVEERVRNDMAFYDSLEGMTEPFSPS